MKTNLTSSASSYFKKNKHTNKNAEWKKTSKQNQKGVSWRSEIASIQKSTEKLHNKGRGKKKMTLLVVFYY